MFDVLIVGGGLAGLVNAVHLSKAGLKVLVLEKNSYPKHKVCGEYISNEVLPYLESLGIQPFQVGATSIHKFLLSAPKGTQIKTQLPLGGFGLSRFTLDNLLYQKAIENGCVVKKATVEKIDFLGEHFEVSTRGGGTYLATFTIGAYGKRSTLDVQLARRFIQKKTPYLAVKSHFTGDFPEDLVALHNFEGGYCGVSKVENGFLNICYLADYKTFKKYRYTETFQQEVLCKNPHLKEIFAAVKPAFARPLSISQISFSPKEKVEKHIFMSGDTAGMIHPLCGNGMGMAIHSAKILSQLLIQFFNQKSSNRATLEMNYTQAWQSAFQKRLRAGRFLNLFLSNNNNLLNAGIGILRFAPGLLPFIIEQTHGKELSAN
ncbi:MAG: NAD(P)/FAD-dependent oxidoreductase [Chitinophagales bacterium]|nr:NAD(P)/FAD-dependent oxidoreductase [Chitinophagales bacterium]